MLLSRDAIGIGDRVLQRRGLLQAGPRPRLRGHHLALHPGGAGRPGDGRRRAAPVRSARRGGRSVGADLAAGQHAVDGQRVPLRPDRRGARAAATAGRGGRRDRRARLQRPRGRHAKWSTGPRRWSSRWPSAGWSTRWRRCATCWPQSLDHLEALVERGETITGVPTGYRDLDDQLAGLQTSNLVVVGARPAMGKTSFALGIVQPRRGARPGAGAAVLAGDEPPRAHPADAVLGGGGRRHPDAQRAPARVGLAARSPTPSAGSATRRSSSTTTPT